MAVIKERQGRRYMIHFAKLICWLGWLTHIVFGQPDVSETVTGSVNFPDLGVTCIGNLAVFFTSFLRGRLDLEIGARDVMAILTGPKLRKINGRNCFALTTGGEGEGLRQCSVVMLSNETPNSSMAQFIKYIYNVYNVQSVLLQCLSLDPEAHTVGPCACPATDQSSRNNNIRTCGCIVFWRGMDDEIAVMLAEQMPGTLKKLPNSLCLLPSRHCLRNGCHGCNQGLQHVYTDPSGNRRLREGNPVVGPPAAACSTLDNSSPSSFLGGSGGCICIPVQGADWTRMLITLFKPKDNETREAIIIIRHAFSSVLGALENPMPGEHHAKEEYNMASLIVPRLTEVLMNVVLTFWFKVDGFSSALVSRRAVRDYILDNRGRGFAAHVFMSLVEVRSSSNGNNTNFCQVLSFRANLLSVRTLSFIVGCVNLICSVSWAVLVALEEGHNKWYHTHSMRPSAARVAVIAVAVAIAVGMDCFDLKLYYSIGGFSRYRRKTLLLCGVIVLEIMCIVSGSTIGGVLGIKFFGRWIYSAVQALVWVKWGIGSYLLGQYPPEYVLRRYPPEYRERTWWLRGGGGGGEIYMYSSAFMLNTILAGVRANWQYS